MSTKLERSRRIFLNWLASMVDGPARKEVTAMLADGTIDKLINDIIEAAEPAEPTGRVVILVSDGLVEGIFVPAYDYPEIPVQVLNVDRDDPVGGARQNAYKAVFFDVGLKSVDWTFLGTEDGD